MTFHNPARGKFCEPPHASGPWLVTFVVPLIFQRPNLVANPVTFCFGAKRFNGSPKNEKKKTLCRRERTINNQ
jgi:hypothetical protein